MGSEILINAKARETFRSLGLDPGCVASRGLPFYEDATELVIADISRSGRKHLLTPKAAKAWAQMKSSAQEDRVSLIIVSAFRSTERQIELVRCKLKEGLDAESIFATMAPPGYSEHHTGRAIDVGTAGCEPLAPAFESTDAYAWLSEHAQEFGFQLSYPKGNELGFCYEPWHWCHHDHGA